MRKLAQTGPSHHSSAVPQQSKEINAERTRAYRQRLKEAGRDRADTPPCLLCGRSIVLGLIDPASPRGQSRTGRALCATCWRKSDEGKAAERERNRNRIRNRSSTPAKQTT